MKLLRLKITDPKGFRSLQTDFEHQFRTEWGLKEDEGFAPFVCAGCNGSGKSNLLEALAAIFYQLEILRVRRSFLPEQFLFDAKSNPNGFKDGDGTPNGFELDYLVRVPEAYSEATKTDYAKIKIVKKVGQSPDIQWINYGDFSLDSDEVAYLERNQGIVGERHRDFLLPQYVLGYSSGENEILSLPFFKMRFIQYDEYWHALQEQLPYSGRPDTRLAYLDNSFSQAILICNFLFQDSVTLKPFREDIGIEDLKEFRIIIRRSIEVSKDVADSFDANNPAIIVDKETGRATVNIMRLLEANADSALKDDSIVTRLKRCATCWFTDDASDTLYLDYSVNEATKQAFRVNFDQSPIELLQAFQVLLVLNLFSVSDRLKTDLYQSDSHYVSETVPTLASDERIMRFKFVKFTKAGINELLMLKSLSDGEYQLLHSLGLCLLFRNTNSLFLLDEPETHFNPDWRSNFITRLHQCFDGAADSHEMLITTHTPFLISDSKPQKVLVFDKDKETAKIRIIPPEYNTFGASINLITMETFDKAETIGRHSQSKLEDLRRRFEAGENKRKLINEINHEIGDSVEKVLLIKTILDNMEQNS